MGETSIDIKSRIADTVLAAQISHGNSGLTLFQNANNLVFGKSAALHLWSFRLGQSLSQTGLDAGGNVTALRTRMICWGTQRCALSGVQRLNGFGDGRLYFASDPRRRLSTTEISRPH
jgi:hypothetical protein